jgi:hypothetical protein
VVEDLLLRDMVVVDCQLPLEGVGAVVVDCPLPLEAVVPSGAALDRRLPSDEGAMVDWQLQGLVVVVCRQPWGMVDRR